MSVIPIPPSKVVKIAVLIAVLSALMYAWMLHLEGY
jgi:hypothetical protein